MRSTAKIFFTICCSVALFIPAAAQTDLAPFKNLKARSIGPAGMSGRVTAIDVVLSDPDIIYLGSASGGLWKSDNGGIEFDPIFDDQPVASIGSIAIHQRIPDIIWVGTGEGNPRNSETGGNGMYRSLDGGRTWSHRGLEETRNIHRVIVHPDNPDVVYAGAQGASWGDSEERGVYRTKDGGSSWEKILYVNERTGVADMIVDPVNPNKILVAMWEYGRKPWTFNSGGEGSGLYLTWDGGDSWKKLEAQDGLPDGNLGRIGLAICHDKPDVAYALIEAKKTGLYRSDNGGITWSKVADENIGNRPFYYADIFVDPQNENRVYNLYSTVTVSEDGGKTFSSLLNDSSVHPDHHAWWIHPEDPNFIIDGNDGGAAISRDRGKTWRFIENLPLAQFYHVRVDDAIPYNVYGGMQDNGSWRGPAYVWRAGGIRNAYWEEVAFGDGFDVLPAPWSDRYLYAMSQGGYLSRTDLISGEQKFIQPRHPENEFLRFNWNAAIAGDPFDKSTMYYGSQFVHKSTDRGDSWTIISPDLTTNDPEKQKQLDSGGLSYDVTQAENFTTIVSIEPSSVEQGVIWVGTDDGNVQLTRDGGLSWTNVVDSIGEVPEGTWVPQIRASSYSGGEVFVVFDNHRRNDWTPYLYYSANYGKTWTRLADETDVFGYCLSFWQDPVEPNLMFLGTEFGLYVSLDGGHSWDKWTHGYPTVSTIDLAYQPREQDLVIGTFGRGAYVLDDIRPLREAASQTDVNDAPLHVFDAPDAYLAERMQATGTRFYANAIFAGENRPSGAMITYAFNAEGEESESQPADDSTNDDDNRIIVEVENEAGDIVRRFSQKPEAGIHRIFWNLRADGTRSPTQPRPEDKNADAPSGDVVLPGMYTVRFIHGENRAETMLSVHTDPRLAIPDPVMERTHQMRWEFMHLEEVATQAADQIRHAQRSVQLIVQQIKFNDSDSLDTLKKKSDAMSDSLKTLMELFTGKEVQGIRRDPNLVTAILGRVSSYLGSSWEGGGPTAALALEQARTAVNDVLERINGFFETQWPEYRNAVQTAEMSIIPAIERVSIE